MKKRMKDNSDGVMVGVLGLTVMTGMASLFTQEMVFVGTALALSIASASFFFMLYIRTRSEQRF